MEKNEIFTRGRNIALMLFHSGLRPDVAMTVLAYQDELAKNIHELTGEASALRTRISALEAENEKLKAMYRLMIEKVGDSGVMDRADIQETASECGLEV